MTSEEYFGLLPVFEALRDGKTIQYRAFTNGCWEDFEDGDRINVEAYEYRVKPSPRIRPFKDGEECWAEMQKHQPLGWLKNDNGFYFVDNIFDVDEDGGGVFVAKIYQSYKSVYDDYTFVDGAPFGIKVEY